MAQYEHLPIYRSAMKLAVHLEVVVRGFPRYVRYTLGSEMRVRAQKIVELVIRANNQHEKRTTLHELRETVESLLVQARICHETNGFRNFTSFVTTIELAGHVARQNEGWLKASGVRGKPEPSSRVATGVQ
jgi:hypothetical protein